MAINAITPDIQTKKSPVKKAARAVATAAVLTGTALLLAKNGKLNPTEGGNKYIEAAKAFVKKGTDKVLPKVEPIADKVVAAVKPAAKKIATAVQPAVDKVKGYVESSSVIANAETTVMGAANKAANFTKNVADKISAFVMR